ncbi:MAG TPA: O-methyltransferase [Terriglobales bacterium]
MQPKTWTVVDDYLNAKLGNSDSVMEGTLAANAEAGLPVFDVAPNQGKLLYLLARMSGAKRILEIGTLGGYSTIWLGRAASAGGVVVTLESEPRHVAVATENIRRAKLECNVDIRSGLALETLEQLVKAEVEPFDFVFIDADKPNNPAYLELAIKLSRPGTVILADNVIREGMIADAENGDPSVQGVRKFFDKIANDTRLIATAIQTVGSKGYDGFALAIVKV